MKLEDAVGQKLMIGVPGTQVTPEIVRHFKDIRAGGLILFPPNFESPAQIKKFISGLESALGRRLLVGLDHEGGRVTMFSKGVTVFPDNGAFGRAGRAEFARRQGEIEAKELRRLGIDVNFSPVLDVRREPYLSPNIGIRSYGYDPERAAALGAARIRAMQAGGLSSCAKHFPGQGSGTLDAHLRVPVISWTWKQMEPDLIPFQKAVDAGVHAVMTSHPYYSEIENKPGRIATFSRRIVREKLREGMKFEGVIFSDDLEMGAVQMICPIGEAAVRAAAAGHDVVLACHDLTAQKEIYRALSAAYKNGRLAVEDLEESRKRINRLKSLRPRRFEGGAPGAEPAGNKLARQIAMAGAVYLRGKRRSWKSKKVSVVFPRLSELLPRVMVETPLQKEEKFISAYFKSKKIKADVLIIGIDPSPAEIAAAKRRAAAADLAVFFCYDATARPRSAGKLLQSLLSTIPGKLSVALLRNPDDFRVFGHEGKEAAWLTAYGWRQCQLEALLKKIFG